MSGSTVTAPTELARIAERVPPPPGGGPSREAIAAAVAAIAARFRPERIVLFGSRAYGRPTAGSDVDLLVVMETPLSLAEQAEQIRQVARAGGTIRFHPTVRTPGQIGVGLAERDFFVVDAIERGITLYRTDGDRMSDRPAGQDAAAPAGSPGLKRATREWLAKADTDDRMAQRAVAPPDPMWDGACFHAQQSAEKHLKALLQEREIGAPRTHDLVVLADLVAPQPPELSALRGELEWLTDFAVTIRYPGVIAGQPEAERSLAVASQLRRLVRRELGVTEQ